MRSRVLYTQPYSGPVGTVSPILRSLPWRDEGRRDALLEEGWLRTHRGREHGDRRWGRGRREGGWKEETSSGLGNLSAPGPGCRGGCCHRLPRPPHPRSGAAHRTRPLATAPGTAGRRPPPRPASAGTESSTCGEENEERSGTSLRKGFIKEQSWAAK